MVQDWRWAVGALPWGPHAHSTQLSAIYTATARRNYFISHVELALQAVQSRMNKVCVGGRGLLIFLTDSLVHLTRPSLI